MGLTDLFGKIAKPVGTAFFSAVTTLSSGLIINLFSGSDIQHENLVIACGLVCVCIGAYLVSVRNRVERQYRHNLQEQISNPWFSACKIGAHRGGFLIGFFLFITGLGVGGYYSFFDNFNKTKSTTDDILVKVNHIDSILMNFDGLNDEGLKRSEEIIIHDTVLIKSPYPSKPWRKKKQPCKCPCEVISKP